MATKKDLPSFDKYYPFVVEAMKARGGSATIEEMEEDVAALMKLPEDLLAIPIKIALVLSLRTSLPGFVLI
jgi:hypothetical protein